MAYEADAPWRVTAQAQLMLGIVVDGVWGPETTSAYRMADASLRGRIDAVLAREQLSAYSVQRVTTSVRRPSVPFKSMNTSTKPSVSPAVSSKEAFERVRKSAPVGSVANRLIGWYSEEQLRPVLSAATAGLPHATLDRMIRKLKLEAAKVSIAGVTYYNARSVNGRYRGLFQMGTAAWSDVQNKLGYTYDAVFDPAINARAAALYIENNVRVARAKGYTGPITDSVVYTMHNQGVGGFLRILNGGSVQGKQSQPAMDVIASAAGRTV